MGRISIHLIISNLSFFAMYINFHSKIKGFSNLLITTSHKCTNNKTVDNRFLLTFKRLKLNYLRIKTNGK